MQTSLCIRVTLLADRYHAGEWPPSPARLFQALVAGTKTCAYAREWPASERVLRALESKPPSEIIAAPGKPLTAYRLSVPNNDSDRAAKEWAAGRKFDAATLRTMKAVSPLELPSPTPDGAHAYYIWADVPPTDSPGTSRLAAHLHTLGWGLDMAYADALNLDEGARNALAASPGMLRYRLDPTGDPVACPAPGFLDELLQLFERKAKRLSHEGIDADIRPRNYAEWRYKRLGSSGPPLACFELRQLDNPDRWFSANPATGHRVAAWLRHAAASALAAEGRPTGFVNEFVLGHGAGRTRHMSFVPLPTVERNHGDGAIRRVMLVEPPASDGTTVALLRQKLAATDLQKLSPGGAPAPACRLSPQTHRDPVIYRYLRHAISWRSVTPVILHGHNTLRRKFSASKTEQLLAQAAEEAGYPLSDVQQLNYQPAPFWPGLPPAFEFLPPRHLAGWPRYHVAIRFRAPIAGPVLIGIGRHYGLGLFAAGDN